MLNVLLIRSGGDRPAAHVRFVMACQDAYCRLRYRKLWREAGL